MANEFLRALDRWVLCILRQKTAESAPDEMPAQVTATDLSLMISDYVLMRVAEQPSSCWSGCGIDEVRNDQILLVTTFSDEALAASFIAAVCELNRWQGEEGVRIMLDHGVPAEDALEIAAAIEVVSGKIGARGQELIVSLARGDAAAREGGHRPMYDVPLRPVGSGRASFGSPEEEEESGAVIGESCRSRAAESRLRLEDSGRT